MSRFGMRRGRANPRRHDSPQHASSPGETASVLEVLRMKKHARSFRPQARETAQRLAQAGNHSTREMWSGSTLYEEVVYRITADDSRGTSITSIANQIVNEAVRLYPNHEKQEARLAAYLSECAAEALVFMLPSSGDEAAMQLRMMVETLRPHDHHWCSAREATIMIGQDGVCPACGIVTDA